MPIMVHRFFGDEVRFLMWVQCLTQKIKKVMKIENMISSKGNYVPNQFIIKHDGKTWFQSYKTIIAVKYEDGSIALDENYWDYSVTTGKYRNLFLGESKKETQEKIDKGIYKLTNLN